MQNFGMSKLRNVVKQSVYYYRIKRGYTQLELAAAINVDKGTISEIERGEVNPKLETLEQIAHALKIEPYLLLLPPPKEK
jgi:transcriptional regulator with XRE-family HTH domain